MSSIHSKNIAAVTVENYILTSLEIASIISNYYLIH